MPRNDYNVDRSRDVVPLSAHTVRRQIEREALRPHHRRGRCTMRAWIDFWPGKNYIGNRRCLLSYELLGCFASNGIGFIEPQEVAITEIGREYTLLHARRNQRSREVVQEVAYVEQHAAQAAAEAAAKQRETNESAADWLATGKQVKNTRPTRDFHEWDVGREELENA